tara:strand:- start:437 stop:910 length:474 start_codon:yes stop_codon:yes gene_type:complete
MSTLKVDTIQGKTTAGTVAMPSGMVIQTVQESTTTQLIHNSTSYGVTSISASITPKFSSSKILVTITSNMEGNAAGEIGFYAIFRDSTNIAQSQIGQASGTSGSPIFPIAIQKLDSPSTTSSVTYALYVKKTTSAIVANINTGGNSDGVITLMEIKQ